VVSVPLALVGGPAGRLQRRVARSPLSLDVDEPARTGVRALVTLTPREREVLSLMAEGRTNAAIAKSFVVTERAVEKHVANIFTKLGLAASDTDHRRVLAVLRYLDGR
jgi:DNA-binding NarL/FixJ family response regulator